VQLVGDEALEKFLPRRAGIVEVTTNDGKTVTERVDDVRGTAENPMSRDEVIAKARDLVVPVLGAAAFDKLVARVFDLERLRSVRELRPLIQKA
jgi:2-methylcitrate dehydratase PrpD